MLRIVVLSVLAAVLVPAQSAPAASDPAFDTCLDFERHPHFLSSVALPAASSVRIEGSTAYVSDHYVGLHVIDIANPRAPRLLGTLFDQHMPFQSYALEKIGDLVYLGWDGDGIAVVDVSDRAHPRMVNRYHDVSAVCLRARGAMLICGGDRELAILDVSVPDAPREVWRFAVPNVVSEMELEGSLLYASIWLGDTLVFDLSDPESPSLYATIPEDLSGRDLDVQGDTVYFASQGTGLQVVDISSPSSPNAVADLPEQESALAVALVGDHVLLADGYAGVRVIDVSDPSAPRNVSHLSSAFVNSGGIEVVGNVVYLCTWRSGLQIYDLARVRPQAILAHRDPQDSDSALVVTALQESDGRLYTAGFPSFRSFALGGSDELQPLASLDLGDVAFNVQVDGKIAYVAAGYSGMVVLDLRNPSSVVELSRFTPHGAERDNAVFDMKIVGHLAYVPSHLYESSFFVVDVQDPRRPVQVGMLPTQNAAHVDVVENLAFLAGYGLRVVDVSNPAQPQQLSHVIFDEPLHDVVAKSGYVFTAPSTSVYDGYAPLRVLDVSDPYAPREVAAINLPGGAEQLTLREGRIYAALNDRGVAVLDVSDPEDPRFEGILDRPYSGFGYSAVAVDEARVYVAGGPGDLWVFPDPCSRTIELSTPVERPVVATASGLQFVASSSSVGKATVVFAIEGSGWVSGTVYDLRGRLIRRLGSEFRLEGEHALHWHGDDEFGQSVARGVYFIRVATSAASQVRKVCLMR